MRTLIRSLILGWLLVAFVSGASAAPLNPILKVPFTINKPGVYVLKKDLTYSAPDGGAITVMADDVTIDFGGRTLTRNAEDGETQTAHGINSAGWKRLTVRNGTIRGFYRGINTSGESIRIREMTIDTSISAGIYINSGQRALIENCNIRDIGSNTELIQWGIACLVPGSIVRDNTVTNVFGTGVRAIQTDSTSIVERNQVLNQNIQPASVGIIMFNGSSFAGNNRVLRFATGISFTNGGGYRDNVTTGSTTPYSGGTDLGNND